MFRHRALFSCTLASIVVLAHIECVRADVAFDATFRTALVSGSDDLGLDGAELGLSIRFDDEATYGEAAVPTGVTPITEFMTINGATVEPTNGTFTASGAGLVFDPNREGQLVGADLSDVEYGIEAETLVLLPLLEAIDCVSTGDSVEVYHVGRTLVSATAHLLARESGARYRALDLKVSVRDSNSSPMNGVPSQPAFGEACAWGLETHLVECTEDGGSLVDVTRYVTPSVSFVPRATVFSRVNFQTTPGTISIGGQSTYGVSTRASARWQGTAIVSPEIAPERVTVRIATVMNASLFGEGGASVLLHARAGHVDHRIEDLCSAPAFAWSSESGPEVPSAEIELDLMYDESLGGYPYTVWGETTTESSSAGNTGNSGGVSVFVGAPIEMLDAFGSEVAFTLLVAADIGRSRVHAKSLDARRECFLSRNGWSAGGSYGLVPVRFEPAL